MRTPAMTCSCLNVLEGSVSATFRMPQPAARLDEERCSVSLDGLVQVDSTACRGIVPSRGMGRRAVCASAAERTVANPASMGHSILNKTERELRRLDAQ